MTQAKQANDWNARRYVTGIELTNDPVLAAWCHAQPNVWCSDITLDVLWNLAHPDNADRLAAHLLRQARQEQT